jgi:hypothetical protein
VNCSASDPSGNTATGSFTVTVRDTTPPAVTPPAPIAVLVTETGGARGASSAALAAFLSGGSSMDAADPAPARLAATVGGTSVDNSTLFPIGTTPVTFRFRDASGNVGAGTSAVTVGYGICFLYDSNVAKKSGSTYPIKVSLCDASGRNLSAPSIVLHAVGVTQTSANIPASLDDSGNANPDFDFRYDSALGGYIFNLSTSGYKTGSYRLNFTAGNDPVVHSAPFAVK